MVYTINIARVHNNNLNYFTGEIEMKETNLHYIDENNNKFAKSKFTAEEAKLESRRVMFVQHDNAMNMLLCAQYLQIIPGCKKNTTEEDISHYDNSFSNVFFDAYNNAIDAFIYDYDNEGIDAYNNAIDEANKTMFEDAKKTMPESEISEILKCCTQCTNRRNCTDCTQSTT